MSSLKKFALLTGAIAFVSNIALAVESGPSGSPASGSTQPLAPVASSAAPSVGAAAVDPAYTYKTLRLNRAAFDALAAKPEQLVVLDIRRPDELLKYGGFPAYLSIQTSDVQKSLAYIPQNRLIVTVSNHAHRAGAVGDILSSYGYHVVGAIGVLDYEAEGGALTKIAAPAPRATSAASTSAPAAPSTP
jgi:rhodanese-related sulfurtransferase